MTFTLNGGSCFCFLSSSFDCRLSCHCKDWKTPDNISYVWCNCMAKNCQNCQGLFDTAWIATWILTGAHCHPTNISKMFFQLPVFSLWHWKSLDVKHNFCLHILSELEHLSSSLSFHTSNHIQSCVCSAFSSLRVSVALIFTPALWARSLYLPKEKSHTLHNIWWIDSVFKIQALQISCVNTV